MAAKRRMTDEDRPVYPVFWGSDRRSAVRPDYILSLQVLATDLYWFGDNVEPAIKKKFKEFKLTEKARKARGDLKYVPGEDADEKEEEDNENAKDSPLYRINKGLTLELLMAQVMYRLDSPEICQANCKIIKRNPSYFAGTGKPDIIVDYGGGFIVHVEVSADRDMELDKLSEQCESALRHMKARKVNWTLLVTPMDRSDAYVKDTYDWFVQRNERDMRNRSIIIMSIKEIAEVGSRLARLQGFRPGGTPIDAGAMPALFEALGNAKTEDKLVDVWVNKVKELMKKKRG